MSTKATIKAEILLRKAIGLKAKPLVLYHDSKGAEKKLYTQGLRAVTTRTEDDGVRRIKVYTERPGSKIEGIIFKRFPKKKVGRVPIKLIAMGK